MYAQLCKRFAEQAPNFESPDTKITTFKRLLLNKCRDEFENRTAVSATFEKRAGSLTGDEEEARFVAKRKMLGNIKFIGELGKLEMLHDSILHRCCEQLLVGRKRQPITEQGEDLECLAYLFKTCGRIIDSAKAKLLVDQYFERIRGIIANNDTPTRIKFLLQDVIDMRENRWIGRKLATPDGPRTIQQVREDAARDGCIYLPHQDNTHLIKTNNMVTNQLQEVLFSKSRNKGMEDIFGGLGTQGPGSLGTGPGVIGGDSESFVGGNVGNGVGSVGNGGSNGGLHNHQHHRHYEPYRNGGGHPFEEKYSANGNGYHRDESRGGSNGGGNDHRDYKPKRDSFESRIVERPDFGDRFTANRNKTHPSNRGGGNGGRGRMDGGDSRSNGSGRSNGYDRSSGSSPHNNSSDKDLPPRFKKMGSFGSDRDGVNGGNERGSSGAPLMRPSSNNVQMMLKPKTPSSLPKSALARLENGMVQTNTSPKLMMTTSEPPVFISKQSANDKKRNNQEKRKEQGPTREEVFGKIDELLTKLADTGSTNEAFTAWKEADIPSKMVNNALIHLFKQIIKITDADQRALTLQLVEQLHAADAITQVHCREGLSRLVASYTNLDAAEQGVVHLTVWSIHTDMVQLADVAEMTEGGATHPFFINVLKRMAVDTTEEAAARLFKASGVKLIDQLPPAQRTEEQLGTILEENKLAFLVPLLAIKTELARQLESAQPAMSADVLLAWIHANVSSDHHADSAFVYALVGALLRFITDRAVTSDASGRASGEMSDKEVAETEKEMILKYKPVLKAFLGASNGLQLCAIYALQVFCFSRGFPKGQLLRWFVALYEADIVDETAFLNWKEDVNDTYPGKGKALFQVNQWLTWLEEAESEEEDEDE